MLDQLPHVPGEWQGLWKRTLLERRGPGSLTNDRPAEVFWLQTPLWHADIRIPAQRPYFSGISSLQECNRAQLEFLAGQEAFFGITRVEGCTCTWSRLMDLNPGTALDVAYMRFESDTLIVESGIAEDYLEHWELVPDSRPAANAESLIPLDGTSFMLAAGEWSICVTPRTKAPSEIDLYAQTADRTLDDLLWQATLVFSLCQKTPSGWTIRLSTLPWLEGRLVEPAESTAACA
ncbi:MAG: hypothetical protein AAF724_14285 [Pseudomonadota bacterium]